MRCLIELEPFLLRVFHILSCTGLNVPIGFGLVQDGHIHNPALLGAICFIYLFDIISTYYGGGIQAAGFDVGKGL